MDLLKTPSVQSLLDSDLESVDSLQCLDIEELDEVEYALPASEAPTLAEALLADEGEIPERAHFVPESTLCSALQVDFLQAVSQQVTQAQVLDGDILCQNCLVRVLHELDRRNIAVNENPNHCICCDISLLRLTGRHSRLIPIGRPERAYIALLIHPRQERSSAGLATALGYAGNGKLTVGTAHGHLLSFREQVLRWVCDSNAERGAVSCLDYNDDSDRLLAGFARGLICQYETSRGVILRRVTLGGETWGILRVTWAGTSGLALDTGGSVWLMKFSRPLGVRAARTSCLFSGARGEVMAMAARDGRVLALATLARVVVVAGGRAAGARLSGPVDVLPALAWCEADTRLLLCARGTTLQWLVAEANGTAVSLRSLRRFELAAPPLWMGWVGGSLAIFDVNENLRLWGDDYDKSLDLSHIEPVYASAFFKGVWTDGRVSQAMSAAGGGALGGASARGGELALLGRRGVVRVRTRDLLARARAIFAADRHMHAIKLLSSSPRTEAIHVARQFILELAERPNLLSDKLLADEVVKLCLKFHMSEELWSTLWEQCSEETAFVEAVGLAAVRGHFSIGEASAAPSPDYSQALIEKLAQCEPGLVERVVASLPLTSLDPHRASLFTMSKGLWRGAGAIAAALGGASAAMRELTKHVSRVCEPEGCRCAGDALLLAAADALAGRGSAGRDLPDHARPSARHDALQTLLSEEMKNGEAISPSPLCALVGHSARSTVRLLEQSWRDPPFVGPLGKQNRLRVARALLHYATDLKEEDQLEIVEFITSQMSSGGLPAERGLCERAASVAARGGGERADRLLLALPPSTALPPAAAARPRLRAARAALAADTATLLLHFSQITDRSDTDVDELFDYLHARVKENGDIIEELEPHMKALVSLRPRAVARILEGHPAAAERALLAAEDEPALTLAAALSEAGALGGDAAAAHFARLCRCAPARAVPFLRAHPSAVRPERALAAVRAAGLGARDAEPLCLEAAGDEEGALDATLRLLTDSQGERAARLLLEACALVTRAAAAAPRALAAAMWTRVLRCAPLPAPALLAALAYLPGEAVLAHACDSPATALRLARSAADEARLWASAALVLRRELHATSARARRAAGRGVGAGARCRACGGALASRGAARVAVCSHTATALHAGCAAPPCRQCTGGVGRTMALPARPASRPAPSLDHDLLLVAPPRPDLEGVV